MPYDTQATGTWRNGAFAAMPILKMQHGDEPDVAGSLPSDVGRQNELHSAEGRERVLSPPKHPVVFLHGVGALANVLNPAGFSPVVDALLRSGVEAAAPVAPPYATIEERAGIWLDQLLRIRDALGASRLNLIAFSGGGLDARFLIARLGGHQWVASLTTVATPHRGTSLASTFSRVDRVSGHLVSRFLSGNRVEPGEPGSSEPAASIGELAPDRLETTFNARTPDHPSVTYFSAAGTAGRGCSNPASLLLSVPNRLLYRHEGRNDGLVSVRSAQWGEFLGTVAADHAALFGISFGRKTFDAVGFYCTLVARLTERGF